MFSTGKSLSEEGEVRLNEELRDTPGKIGMPFSVQETAVQRHWGRAEHGHDSLVTGRWEEMVGSCGQAETAEGTVERRQGLDEPSLDSLLWSQDCKGWGRKIL